MPSLINKKLNDASDIHIVKNIFGCDLSYFKFLVYFFIKGLTE